MLRRIGGKGSGMDVDARCSGCRRQSFGIGEEGVAAVARVFQYPKGVHNVFKVNGTGFQYCTKPPLKEALTTGNDTIVLATPGRKWYICGVAQHCALAGQKLAITVNSMAPAPSVYPSMTYGPSQAMPYSNMANGIIVNMFHSFMVVVVAVLLSFGV
ncbi:unnamed protein product [Ilex paraguariensis]